MCLVHGTHWEVGLCSLLNMFSVCLFIILLHLFILILHQIEIKELDDLAQAAFHGYKSLNRIQSRIFQTVYHTNENILVRFFFLI